MDRSSPPPDRWTSLWIVALISLVAQLALCQFFSFGARVPLSLDVDPCNLWKYGYQFPPRGEYLVLNWLGVPYLPPTLNPFSLAAHLSAWWFFTTFTPFIGTCALLAMAAFLRELEVPRPAALFGAIIFAWQGDILPFVFPGHYAYIATWPFFALAAWGALRAERTGYWAYALVSGASCGMMVGLQPDRGGIVSLLIAAIYLASAWRSGAAWLRGIAHLALCAAVALAISLAAFLALFQSFIIGTSMGGEKSREEIYKFDTQFCYGPEETLTYLVPGFFGWHSSSEDGPYWGRIGQWPDWPAKHEGLRNLNLAISTTGTVATSLALLAGILLFGSRRRDWLGVATTSERQRFYGRLLLALGAVGLVLAWGYHTPFYRLIFALPFMDKWRDPLKWLEWTNFALVTLSAFGVQHLFGVLEAVEAAVRNRLPRILWVLTGAAVLLWIGFLAGYPFTTELAPRLLASDYQPDLVANIMRTIHLSLCVAAISMSLACLVVYALSRPEPFRRLTLENPWLHRAWHAMLEPKNLPSTLALGLALICVGQLAWVATEFIRPTDLIILTESNPLLEELKLQGNTVRVSVDDHDPALNILLQNQFATPLISCLEISAASRIPDDLTVFLNNLNPYPSRLWFLAGVKNRVIPQPTFAGLQQDPRIMTNVDHVDGYTLEPTGSPNLPSHALVQFRDYLAKATFVPEMEILSDKAQLERLKDPNWDPRKSILLTAAPKPKTSSLEAQGASAAKVEVSTYDSHRIEISVHAPHPGYILINDAYDPDWQVQVNGLTTPLLRADFMLRAFAVPAGNSTVMLDYIAHYRLAGFALPVVVVNETCDAVMLASWIVAGVALWRRRIAPIATRGEG